MIHNVMDLSAAALGERQSVDKMGTAMLRVSLCDFSSNMHNYIVNLEHVKVRTCKRRRVSTR